MKPTNRSQSFDLPVNLTADAARSAVKPSEVLSAKLMVTCPLSHEAVLLQRCAFCEHSAGLLLDPSDDRLTLRCVHEWTDWRGG